MLWPMESFAAARVATLPLDEVAKVLPMSADRWLVHRRSMAREMAVVELLVVDAQLAPIWRLPVPDPYHGVHAVTSDLSLVALSLQHRVLLLDGRGQQLASFPHQPWGMGDPDSGCCAFSPCGRYLWATVPTWPQGSWQANDELWLIDLASPSVVDRRKLDVCAAGSTPVQHPDGHTVGLDIGKGQDGAAIRWARADRGHIGLRFAPGDDRFLAAVHPDGQEYLTTPHANNDRLQALARHRFADDRPIERLASAAAFAAFGPSSQQWGHEAGYLTSELILAVTYGGLRHMLVQRAPLRLLGEVIYPEVGAAVCPEGLCPEGQPRRWPVAAHQGTWLTRSCKGLQRWTLLPQLAR
jgi:hypothetical protein